MADNPYLDDPDSKAKIMEALEARERGATYRQRVKVTTRGIAAHRPARTLYVAALQWGLKATYAHDGGLLVRRHVIAVEGDPVEVVKFELIAMRRYPAP